MTEGLLIHNVIADSVEYDTAVAIWHHKAAQYHAVRCAMREDLAPSSENIRMIGMI